MKVALSQLVHGFAEYNLHSIQPEVNRISLKLRFKQLLDYLYYPDEFIRQVVGIVEPWTREQAPYHEKHLRSSQANNAELRTQLRDRKFLLNRSMETVDVAGRANPTFNAQNKLLMIKNDFLFLFYHTYLDLLQ